MAATSKPGGPTRADRIAIWLILGAGFLGGAFVAGLGLFTAISRLIDPARYPVSLLADIPVEIGPGVLQAHGDSVVVNADGLSPSTVWTLAAGDLFLALTIGIVTVAFSVVLLRVTQRRPFHRSMQIAVLVAGCAIAFGSLLSQGIGGLGQMMAATDLEGTLGDIATPGFLFAPLPIIIGFAIMALAYVFQAGERLQRDQEGLV